MNETLEARLLCAANVAYTLDMTQPYFDGARFKTFSTFKSDDGVNAAVAGATCDGLVIAFRGTIAVTDAAASIHQRLKDWIEDCRDELICIAPFPPRIHAGFFADLNSLWNTMAPQLIGHWRGDLSPETPVYFTGHSKGGALALMASQLWSAMTGNIPNVVTFAAPKAGDGNFAKHCMGKITRYEFGDDVVPHLPPRDVMLDLLGRSLMHVFDNSQDFDYQHAGTLVYCDGKRPPQTPTNQWQETNLRDVRETNLLDRILELEANAIIADHHITQGSGYWNWICGSELKRDRDST